MILKRKFENEYLLSNGKGELSFWMLEDNSICIYDQIFNEISNNDLLDIIKLLEHYATKNNLVEIKIAATPNKETLEFWTSLSYEYTNYEVDKDDIHQILNLPDCKEVFDNDSGVIMFHKSLSELKNGSFLNKIFNKDVIEVLKQLPSSSLDMVYGDPDYNVGINYAGKNYTTKWNDYIDWYIELTRESMRVLKPTGNLFMMNYPKQNAHLRVKYLDDNAFDVQDYVWIYNTNVGHTPRRFTTAHRSILHATKSKENNFYKDQVSVPYQNPTDKRIQGRIASGHLGRMPYSWFYFDLVKNVSKDKTFHACQIPLPLVEMLIKSCTQENDDVFILFGGSGSELMLCKKLKRNFTSCELHKNYYEMILDRLKNNGQIKDEFRLEFVQEKKNYQQVNQLLFF